MACLPQRARAPQIAEFDYSTECKLAHELPYTTSQMLNMYESNVGAKHSRHQKVYASLPTLLPIGPSMYADDVHEALAWYKDYMPYFATLAYTESKQCAVGIVGFRNQQDIDFVMPVRYVRNLGAAGADADFTATAFEGYIKDVHAKYMRANGGWDAWMDRHIGLNVYNCSLDSYIRKLSDQGESYHAHTRSGESGSGIPKDHLWTTGNSGEGVELRGTLKGEIQSCYEFFDWCTWDTEPKKHCCCNDDQCYHSCVESHPYATDVCRMPGEMLNTSVCALSGR